jgi:hypothetical protein
MPDHILPDEDGPPCAPIDVAAVRAGGWERTMFLDGDDYAIGLYRSLVDPRVGAYRAAPRDPRPGDPVMVLFSVEGVSAEFATLEEAAAACAERAPVAKEERADGR